MRLPQPQPVKELPPLPKEYFWREHNCPFSGQLFDSVAVKAKACIVLSRDPDFRPHYDGVNPLHYAVVVSPAGLAAEESVFKRSTELLFKDRRALLEVLRNARNQMELCRNQRLQAKDACGYEILRGEIDGIVTAKLDLSRFKSEADLAGWVAKRLEEDA